MGPTDPIGVYRKIPEAKELFKAHCKKLHQHPWTLYRLVADSYRASNQ